MSVFNLFLKLSIFKIKGLIVLLDVAEFLLEKIDMGFAFLCVKEVKKGQSMSLTSIIFSNSSTALGIISFSFLATYDCSTLFLKIVILLAKKSLKFASLDFLIFLDFFEILAFSMGFLAGVLRWLVMSLRRDFILDTIDCFWWDLLASFWVFGIIVWDIKTWFLCKFQI